MTTFSTNCTLPPKDNVTFVKSPNTRGTLDIVWSCLSVLLICTWSILHLNVPLQSSPRNWKQKYARALYRTFWKCCWMIVNLLSPEYAFGKALCDYRAVSGVKTDFDNSQKRQAVPWSRSYIYFANMGGFAVKFDETTAAAPLQDSDSDSEVLVVENDDSDANDPAGMYYSHLNQRLQSQVELVDWQATHSPREDSASPVQDKLRLSSFPRLSRWIGPIWWKEDETNSSSMDQAFRECLDINDYNYDKYCENLEQLQADIWVLDAKQLLQAWEYGIIDKLPAVTEDDISDKNKSDFVVKILAVGQIVWFVIQLGDRLYSKLPISLLEILTFSFAVCTIFTYGLLLDKPKNAESTIVICATRYASPWEITKIAELGPFCPAITRKSPWIPNLSFHEQGPSSVRLGGGVTCRCGVWGNSLCRMEFHLSKRDRADSMAHKCYCDSSCLALGSCLGLVALEIRR